MTMKHHHGPAQDVITGRWDGAIDTMGQQLPMVVVFDVGGGALAATLDIQGKTGIPLLNISYEGSSISFELHGSWGTMTFQGEHQGDEITGKFTQAGMAGTFSLTRGGAPAEETPLEPVPYREEEVTFGNGELNFAGTLTLPESSGPYPAVVMITGSGPQNRDEEVAGFKVFRVIADHFTRHGIAVLRYDDRGVGGSDGDVMESTSHDFAGDAVAAIAMLMNRSDIRSGQIGLVGHSEGGVVAPIAAVRSDDVAFIILIAGTSVTGEEILLEQRALIARVNGATEEALAEMRDRRERSVKAIRSGEGLEEFAEETREQIRVQIEKMTEKEREAIIDVDAYTESQVSHLLAMMKTPWFRTFLDYDPSVTLRKVKVPTLAVFGGLDLQVPPAQNRGPMEEALRASGTDYSIRVLPKANHLFQEATTGSPTEYATLPKEFIPGFLELMTEWIRTKTTPSS